MDFLSELATIIIFLIFLIFSFIFYGIIGVTFYFIEQPIKSIKISNDFTSNFVSFGSFLKISA